MSAAVFTGTVLEIVFPAPTVLPPVTGPRPAARRAAGDPVFEFPLRTVRIAVNDAFTGIQPGATQIDLVTGLGGGDCGYPFQIGEKYIVYAYRNSKGNLQTGTCSRTRPFAQAAEDIQYFASRAGGPDTADLRVRTGYPGTPARSGVAIIAETDGARYQARTDSAGQALFTGLTSGKYKIHSAEDGDLPDDPAVDLHAKGCVDLTLFRILKITGQVTTAGGEPAGRIEIQFRSLDGKYKEGRMTKPNGTYELPIYRPGRYRVGVNLNQSARGDTPYPRWFYPGTADEAAAAEIEFNGKPETRVLDLALPRPLAGRLVEGVVFGRDGEPRPRALVTAFDASQAIIAQTSTDPNGHFAVNLFADTTYTLEAVWGGMAPDAVSALPIEIQQGRNTLDLEVVLTEPGNSTLKRLQQRSMK